MMSIRIASFCVACVNEQSQRPLHVDAMHATARKVVIAPRPSGADGKAKGRRYSLRSRIVFRREVLQWQTGGFIVTDRRCYDSIFLDSSPLSLFNTPSTLR